MDQRHWILLAATCLLTWSVVACGRCANAQQQPAPVAPSAATADDAPQPKGEQGSTAQRAVTSNRAEVVVPLLVLILGIAIVLGLIIGLKVNAFIALITAAMVVSLCAPGAWSEKISRVAVAFGGTAGGIGIVIALAAVIGKCMLDSGAADRIVRAFVRLLGERQAPVALMGSGYVLAIPVFFDTVFYLLVPLARSLHRRTGKQYLKYILAIAAGGALTHSLVPPTPGPLLMASTLNIDLGMMIMVGAMVALPAAFGGVLFADVADRLMKTPMRQLGAEPEPDPLKDAELPPLSLAILPVLLPVLMISVNTVLTTYADLQPTARFKPGDVLDWPALREQLLAASDQQPPSPATRLWHMLPQQQRELIGKSEPLTDDEQNALDAALNQVLSEKDFYQEDAFLGVRLQETTKKLLGQDRTRMRRAVLERMNRLLLEDAFNRGSQTLIQPHVWDTGRRKAANISGLFGNANLALLISTVIAMWMLVRQRGLTRTELALGVESSLMSGGVIILITAGGGAFGAMLQKAQIGSAIETLFGQFLGGGAGGGLAYLVLGFLLASLLKIAQGSGTVAMIVGSSMMAAIVTPDQLGYNIVYLATAIGAGSLVGSWMNDSGFWIFAKMGGLTETEALQSWTLMLIFLGFISFAVTLLLAYFLPLA